MEMCGKHRVAGRLFMKRKSSWSAVYDVSQWTAFRQKSEAVPHET